jgi:hypothetical protein
VTAEELAKARRILMKTNKSYIVIVEHGDELFESKRFETREDAERYINGISYRLFVGDSALGIRVRTTFTIIEM